MLKLETSQTELFILPPMTGKPIFTPSGERVLVDRELESPRVWANLYETEKGLLWFSRGPKSPILRHEVSAVKSLNSPLLPEIQNLWCWKDRCFVLFHAKPVEPPEDLCVSVVSLAREVLDLGYLLYSMGWVEGSVYLDIWPLNAPIPDWLPAGDPEVMAGSAVLSLLGYGGTAPLDEVIDICFPRRRAFLQLGSELKPILDDKKEVIIGRPTSTFKPDVSIEDPMKFISRRHARIFTEDGRKFYLEDLGSRNKTCIWRNGELIPVNGVIELKDGDWIVLACKKGRMYKIVRFLLR